MSVSYNEAVQAQETYEDAILQDPNVLSLGVIAENDDTGKPVDYIVQIGVASLEDYYQSLKNGTSVIPNELSIICQDTTRHIRIKVVNEGKIEALSKSNSFPEFPSTVNKLNSLSKISYPSQIKALVDPNRMMFTGCLSLSFFNPFRTVSQGYSSKIPILFFQDKNIHQKVFHRKIGMAVGFSLAFAKSVSFFCKKHSSTYIGPVRLADKIDKPSVFVKFKGFK